MFLNNINLVNFKNHSTLSGKFTRKINCIIGKNGVGKTNLIDSIYYLCLTKSYFNSIDQQNILLGKDFFRIDGFFSKGTPHLNGSGRNELHEPEIANGLAETFHVVYKLPTGKKKELLINDSPVMRLSDHIGNFPCIIISPDDSQLILGNSDERRKFLDITISQVNHQYLEWLISYNKVLMQRNAALRSFAEHRNTDHRLLESYDRQLVPLGNNIYEARKVVTEKLKPLFQKFYRQLSLERESVSFNYSSQLNEKPFEQLLQGSVSKDIALQRTDAGIHKDDLEFFIAHRFHHEDRKQATHEYPASQVSDPGDENIQQEASGTEIRQGRNSRMKKFGSQGQQKSFIISMKFAQYALIGNSCLTKPLLLIDDIFDKLDNDRSQKLIELLAGEEFGQIFLTDTEESHIAETLKGREELYEVIAIER